MNEAQARALELVVLQWGRAKDRAEMQRARLELLISERLQWGRAKDRAEIAKPMWRRLVKHPASMGPRERSRGNFDYRFDD